MYRLPWNVLRSSVVRGRCTFKTLLLLLGKFQASTRTRLPMECIVMVVNCSSRRKLEKIRLCAVQSSRSQCVGQSGAGYLARSSVNVLHKSLRGLSQNNFAKYLCPNTHDFTIFPLLSPGLVYFYWWYFYWNSWRLGIYLSRYQIKYCPPHPDVYCQSAGLGAISCPLNL